MNNNQTEILQPLKIGTIIKGTVISIDKLYSILKVDSIKCVLPTSEMTWNKKPRCNVKKGDEVEAVVVKIEDGRVMLSTKRLINNPWNDIHSRYKVGDQQKVSVVKILSFGAFVEIEPGLVALYHRSEMNVDKGDKIKDLFNIGDTLTLEIATIDIVNQKISMKNLTKEELD